MASSRRSGGGSVRGSLNDSFPIVAGGDGERLTAQLSDAAASLGTLIDQGATAWAAAGKPGWFAGGAASSSPFSPRIQLQAPTPGAPSPQLIRVSAAFLAPDFSLGDALAAFAFLHIHTHAPQVIQSLFPARLELARVLALLPLSSSAATAAGQPSLSLSKAPRGSGASGGGPDSSVLRLLWAGSGGRGWKKQQGPAELVLAQRTGRLSTAVGGDVVYHLATTVRDPEQIPALAGGLGGNGDGGRGIKTQGQGQQEGALAFALLVGHSAEQGCLEATLLAPQGGGLFDARRDAGALRAANAALSRYVAETIRAHRALSLGLPDLTLALISPFTTMHRILLRMPEASQPTGPAPARLSSASVYSSNVGASRAPQPNYRVVSVRFLSKTPGLFAVAGLAPADQALLPAWVMEKIMYHPFRGQEVAEVRFVASSETKELTLVWSGLGKGRLHRYIVDVKLVHRSALSRTLALLEAAFHLPRAGATHAALAQAKQRRARYQLSLSTNTKKTQIPSPLEVAAHRPTTVTVIRHPHHLREAVLPLALALPVPLSTATQRRLPTEPARARAKRPGQGKGRYGAPEETGVATSYAASLSAGLLPHLIHPPGQLVAALDALWPLLLWASFHAFLYFGLQSFPEFAVALDTMPLWGLSLGLGLVHLSLGLTLYALVTSKVPLYLRLAHLEFGVLSPKWWWRLVVHSHLCTTILATTLVGLAARVTTLRGGLAESRIVMAFLLSLQLENLAEDKLLLISGMGALSLLVVLAVTGLHLLAGSNRALNVGLIVLLDRLGVLRPIEAPASYLLHPFGRHHQVHRSSSASAPATATGAAAAHPASKDSLGSSTSSSLDASGAPAGSNSHALKTPAASPAAPLSAASRVSSLRKGLANALSPQSALSKKMMATPDINPTPTPGSSKQAAATPASSGEPPTTPHKSSFESRLLSATPASAASDRSSLNPRPSPLASPPAARTSVGSSAAAAAAAVAAAEAAAATTLVAAESQTTPLPAQPAVEWRDAAVQHEAEASASAASETKGSSPAVAAGGGGGFGEAVEALDFERATARPTADRPMQKSGMVKELRATGSGLARNRVWKEVWLQVDADVLTVYKQRREVGRPSVIHHRIPILELGVRRILGPDHAGFALYGPGAPGQQGIELRCEGGEEEVDKWISTMTWNQLVAGRKLAVHQQHQG